MKPYIPPILNYDLIITMAQIILDKAGTVGKGFSLLL